MQTQLRIVSGLLRGRKITCRVEPELRPMPDRVRESLFSILYPNIADRPFFDLFAGTGAVGLEALSRGAFPVVFVELEGKVSAEIFQHVKAFGVADRAFVRRADVFRWVERWQAPVEAVTVFLGPPFPFLFKRCDALMAVTATLQGKLASGSILVIQTEKDFDPSQLPEPDAWEHRLYGRNRISLWRLGDNPETPQEPATDEPS